MSATNDEMEALEGWLEQGKKAVVGGVGALVGTALAGPIGATAGGLIGGMAPPVIESTLASLGKEFRHRVLGQREELRVAVTFSLAADKISLRIMAGDKPREDGFFKPILGGRSAAQEVMEGVLIACQRSFEERKIQYLANLVANIAFEANVTQYMANCLVSMAERLSYQQLCAISVFALNPESPDESILRKGDYRGYGDFSYPLVNLLHEVLDLYNTGLINNGGSVIFGLTDINPSAVKIQGNGALLYGLMELSKIPKDDVNAVRNLLL